MHQFVEISTQTLTHLCIALLSGYLSFSSFLATSITETMTDWGMFSQSTRLTQSEQNISTEKGETLTRLPSQYEIGGPIPRVLLENAAYQQAAVAASDNVPGDISTSSTQITDALVNIFCTYKEGNELHATTGSGVFIDAKGIILTNAHVAQFLLLRQTRKDSRCVVRQGNPAQEKYTADLLYISPAWIHENANLIDAAKPSGTGERDYALLFVNGALKGTLPQTFPFLPFDTTFLGSRSNREVLAAGYPAKIFGIEGPRAELIPRVAHTNISDMFTFGSGKADVMAIHDSIVGEQGSSGGPITTPHGTVIGLIVTRGNQKDGAKSLRAITLAYINQTILSETGFDLHATLQGNIARRSDIFKQALIPFLSSLLETELHS